MDTVADKLREARAFIQKGWTRGETSRGRLVCSIGALNKAFTGDPDDYGHYRYPTRKKASELLSAAVGTRLVADWNDKQPSKKPVLAAFDRAIDLAEAGQ